MSQLVACRTDHCLLLAADRRVEHREVSEKTIRLEKKLYRLGHRTAVATSGAAIGIDVSQRLSQTLGQSRALPFDEIETYILSVFQREYDAFTKHGARYFDENPEALRLSYILLGGMSGEGSPTLRFYASEDHASPYAPMKIGSVLTAPRRLGLEMRLSQALGKGGSPPELKAIIVAGLRQICDRENTVGGGFEVGQIDQDGLVIESFEAAER